MGLAALVLAHPAIYSRQPVYIVLIVAVLASGLYSLVKGRPDGAGLLPPRAVVAAAVVLAISSVVAWLLSPRAPWSSLFFLAAQFLFLWLGWWLARARRLVTLLGFAALIGAGGASLYGLLQYLAVDPLPSATPFVDRVVSSFENPNYFANYLAVLLPVGLAAFFRSSSPRVRLAWGVVVGAVYAGLVVAGSRGAWWAAMAGCLVLSGGFLFQVWRRVALLRPLWVGGLAIWLGLITLILSERTMVASPTGPVSVGERMASSANIVGPGAQLDYTINHRYRIWQVAKEMIREKPLVGQGYGAFPSRFVEVRRGLQERGEFPTEQWNTYFDSDYAHNEFLQIWAESGVFALLGFVALIAAVIWGAARAGWRPRSERLDLWAALGLVTAMLVHSLVSYPLHLPLNGMLFWLALGALASREFVEG